MSPRESLMVLPQLSDSSAANSSASCSMRSASLNSSRPRSAASILPHGPVSSSALAPLSLRDRRLWPSRDLGDHFARGRVERVEGAAVDGSTHSLLIKQPCLCTAGAVGRFAVVWTMVGLS